MAKASVILLGPQRRRPTVGRVVADLGLSGPFGFVTSGWQEREAEDEELRQVCGDAYNLALYRRLEEVMAEDEAFAGRLRERQEKLRRLQELYRLRLSDAMRSARRLLDQSGDLVEAEQSSAIEMVRQLDRHHLARVAEVHRGFDRHSAVLDRHQAEVAQLVHDAQAVIIAGGHVVVLLNRLELFGLADLLHHKPVIAWSAGAMVISERIVLFHDHPPQGAGDAEMLDRGLSICRGVLPLPDGSSRLSLDDPGRVALFARRFAELRPAVLDPACRLDYAAPSYEAHGVKTLRADGEVSAW